IVSGGNDGTIRLWDLPALDVPVPEPEQERLRLAEVVSDLESAKDLLGITPDVHTIAAVLAAKTTTPPLSIALLGDWGIGKSSFMRQLRDRVTLLPQQSTKDSSSAFVANVRQVKFNAWHYSDDHLSVGLVELLCRALPTPDAEA